MKLAVPILGTMNWLDTINGIRSRD